ncbi:MAG: hypothetical protein H0V15_01780 [Solirubrobacterales bacterium]|nr:hypothetical protein [Solirubrobacterales bacterium]
MLPTRLTILAAVAVAATLTLAACGGDDDSGSDDEADITDVIEVSATETTLENCTELQTQAFTEQTEFSTGEEAITACEEDGDDTAGESVEVDNIEVDGDTATSEASFTGGGLDGQTLGLSLVKEDDQWKLDSLDEFVDFDKARFTAALVEDAASDGDAPPELLTCVEEQIGAASDEDIQTAFLSGDEQQLVGLFGICFQ